MAVRVARVSSSLYARYFEKNPPDPRGRRSPPTKDRDRLVHSSALRRLQGKSQIFGAGMTDFFRNRLTHSLECAQIGRAIAVRTAKSDSSEVVEHDAEFPDLVEAACLAHDLGHPPFGHNGELALRAKMIEHNDTLFEGNAQSFRIVSFVEPKDFGPTADGDRWVGLNLCRSTLRAMMKYPWHETEEMRRRVEDDPLRSEKFGCYAALEDREYFEMDLGGRHSCEDGRRPDHGRCR